MSHHTTGTPPIDDAAVEAIAREADVDARTVVRRLAGLPVRGRPGRRIDAAIAVRMSARKQSEPPPRAA